jgi:hypothetical protein
VVTQSWSSCGPPNVHAVICAAGSGSTASSSPSAVVEDVERADGMLDQAGRPTRG